MTVNKQVEVFLEETINGSTGVCQVQLITPQLSPTPTHQLANNLMAEKRKPDLAKWYHVKLFSFVNHTLVQANKKGYSSTWPNLTSNLINKHLPPSMATDKGHMHQTSKNINSKNHQDTGTTHQYSVH